MRAAIAEFSKVPEITFGFWLIKIAATTLGETGGDTVTMTLNWGYLAGTALFLAALIVLVIAQILAKRFQPFLYWATIVASTTFGTTMADFADRSLGIGYTGGSTLLFVCLVIVLGLWYRSQGTISVNTVSTPRWKPSTGRLSSSRRHLGPPSAIGWPTQAGLDTSAARLSSPTFVSRATGPTPKAWGRSSSTDFHHRRHCPAVKHRTKPMHSSSRW
jgi:hypothetical protein